MGYIITGYALVPCESTKMMVMKTDSTGAILWQRIYQEDGDEGANDICQSGDGGYVLVGYNDNDFWNADVYLVKINSLGDTIWSRTFGGNSSDCGNALLRTTDDCYVMAGYTTSFGAGHADVYLMKIDFVKTPPPGDVKTPNQFVLLAPSAESLQSNSIVTLRSPGVRSSQSNYLQSSWSKSGRLSSTGIKVPAPIPQLGTPATSPQVYISVE